MFLLLSAVSLELEKEGKYPKSRVHGQFKTTQPKRTDCARWMGEFTEKLTSFLVFDKENNNNKIIFNKHGIFF